MDRSWARSAEEPGGGILPVAAPGLPAEIRLRECWHPANPLGILAADAGTGASLEAVGSRSLGERPRDDLDVSRKALKRRLDTLLR